MVYRFRAQALSMPTQSLRPDLQNQSFHSEAEEPVNGDLKLPCQKIVSDVVECMTEYEWPNATN